MGDATAEQTLVPQNLKSSQQCSPCNLLCPAKHRLPLGLIRMRCAPTTCRIVVRGPEISPVCASDGRGRHAAFIRGPVKRGRCKTPDAHRGDSPLTDPTRADCLTHPCATMRDVTALYPSRCAGFRHRGVSTVISAARLRAFRAQTIRSRALSG